MKVLLISLEFADPIFSGNGVYSRTIARSLLKTGHEVMVISGRPAEHAGSTAEGIDDVALLTVPCDIWKRLDRYSAWEQFGRGAGEHVTTVKRFDPTVTIGVDWTSVLAFQQLDLGSVPLVYMNFRIATHSTGVSPEDVSFYTEKEAAAMDASALNVALCNMDGRILQQIYPHTVPPAVLSPCLREDIKLQATALLSNPAPKKRRFITCCSRITPEKNVHKFVELCGLLKEDIAAQGLVPYLVGSKIPGEYADKVVADLKLSFPGETSIVKDFMPPTELALVFQESILLVVTSQKHNPNPNSNPYRSCHPSTIRGAWWSQRPQPLVSPLCSTPEASVLPTSSYPPRCRSPSTSNKRAVWKRPTVSGLPSATSRAWPRWEIVPAQPV